MSSVARNVLQYRPEFYAKRTWSEITDTAYIYFKMIIQIEYKLHTNMVLELVSRVKFEWLEVTFRIHNYRICIWFIKMPKHFVIYMSL